jgi:hypothetical protein
MSDRHPLGMNQLWYYKGFMKSLPSTAKRMALWLRPHRYPFLLGVLVFNGLVYALPVPDDDASKKESPWTGHVMRHDEEYNHRQEQHWQKVYAQKQLDKLLGGKH